MATQRASTRPVTGAPEVKLMLTAAAMAATLGGWMVMASNDALASNQAAMSGVAAAQSAPSAQNAPAFTSSNSSNSNTPAQAPSLNGLRQVTAPQVTVRTRSSR